MSHFTQITTEIRDETALADACRELGLPLVRNGAARGYGGQETRGEYVIRLAGPYDAALNRAPDGTLHITADLWQGHVEQELGRDFCRLRQLYGVHCALREGRRQGLRCTRVPLSDGGIRVTLQQRA